MVSFLIDNFELTEEEATIFAASFYSQEYSKGDLFVPCGKTCNPIGFVKKKGILKCIKTAKKKKPLMSFTLIIKPLRSIVFIT